MKLTALLLGLTLSFNLCAYEVYYNVLKDNEEIGQLCLDKSIEFLSMGEEIRIQGHIGDSTLDHVYVRMQDRNFQSCRKPKDMPPTCEVKSAAWIRFHLEKDLVPQAPVDLFFNLPDFSKGFSGQFELTLNSDKK